MFIQKREKYLILENLKQAKQYLDKKSIPLDIPEFQHIVNSLNKLPNLIDTFTRMVFTEDSMDLDMGLVTSNLTEFDRIINWIKTNQNIVSQLPKNLNQYKDLEHLSDDITNLESDRDSKLFVKSLYRSMRDEVNDLEGEEEEHFNDIATAFMKLDKKTKGQFTPLKHFKMNNISIKDFIKGLTRFVNGQDVNENKDKVYKYIKENTSKLEVYYDEGDILIIQTNDGDAVIELGSQKWCVVYNPEHYQEQYFGEKTKNTQYIIYNFNLPASSRYSMFGVTINIKGDVTGSGGCQDKLNRYTPLDEVYELLEITDISETHLVSMYNEEYESFLTKLTKFGEMFNDNSTNVNITQYKYLLNISKIANKLGLRSDVISKIKSWLNLYIEQEINDELTIDEFTEVLQKIQNRFTELEVSVDISSIKTKFMNVKLTQINLVSIPTLNELIEKSKYIIAIFSEFSVKTDPISLNILQWFSKNIKNNVNENIKLIVELLNLGYLIRSEIGYYLYKNHEDLFNEIVDEITTNKETLTWFFIENSQFINALNLRFSVFVDRVLELTENDIIYLFYIYNNHIYGKYQDENIFIKYDDKNNRRGDENISIYIDDTKLKPINDKIPKNELTADLILQYSSEMMEIAKKLTKIPIILNGEESTAIDILVDMDANAANVIEDFMDMKGGYGYNVKDIISFEQFIDGYPKLKDYIDDDYIVENMSEIYFHYNDHDEELMQLIIDINSDEELFDVSDLIDPDYIYDTSHVSNNYLIFIGNLLIKLKPNEYLDSTKSSMILYCLSLVDQNYTNRFKTEMGLTYSEEDKVWYTKTNYSDLGEYFEDTFDFETFAEDWWAYGNDYDYSSDAFEHIDIGNLEILGRYFKSNGFDIDTKPFDKYYIKEYISEHTGDIDIKYSDSMRIYGEDKELSSVQSTIESMIDQSYDYTDYGIEEDPYDVIDISEVKGIISIAYEYAEHNVRESDYFNVQASTIGDALLYSWSDKSNSFGNKYFKWDNDGSHILVIPDLDGLMTGDAIYESIVDQESPDDFTIDTLIDVYFEYNGKLSNATDQGYAYLRDADYEYFNEELENKIHENILYIERENVNITESIILKFNDFLTERKIEDLDNPDRFLSEFGHDRERAEWDMEYYSDTIEKLNNEGGEVYRLLFLEDLSDLDTDSLGEHWCMQIDQLSNFYSSLDDNIGKPYLITGHLKPNQIDLDMSYGQYELLPYELEVNLLSDPERYDIKPYRDTHKAKTLWESITY